MALDCRSEMHESQYNGCCLTDQALRSLLLSLCTFSIAISFARHSSGQAPDKALSSSSDDSQGEPAGSGNNRRFEQILRSRPQEGTALDKFYEALLQQDQLKSYCDSLLQESSDKKDGRLYQLLGLLLSKQRMDDDAIVAFENARSLRPNDATTHLYLARAYYSTGQNAAVYQSLRTALTIKPQPGSIPNLIQLLVKVYRRAEDHQSLAEVGGMIESQFSSNSGVLRKLSEAYLECKSPELAKPLLGKLISNAKSPQDEIELRLQLADIEVQLGRNTEAIALLEQTLGRVNPDSWLSESITQNLERLIEKQGGPAALIVYYRNKIDELKQKPSGNRKPSSNRDELKVMLRLATILIQSARSDDAIEVIREAQLIAPSDTKPWLLLEEIQNARRDFAEAAATMKKLVELDENNIDYRVRWGRYVSMIASDEKRNRDEAAAIWSQLLNGRENDPAMAVRIAELMHGISRTEDAVAYYQKAVSFSGNAAQYREYLGEYLFRLGQSGQALAVLQNIPEKERDSQGYVRLSEVLSQMHFKSESLEALLQACDLNPSCETLIHAAEMLRAEGRFDDALERLNAAEKIAMRTSEVAKVWAQQLVVLPQTGSVAERIEAMAKKKPLGTDNQETSRYFQRLALLYQANGELESAAESVSIAVQSTPNSAFAWLSASMVFRSANLPMRELQALDNLCRLDMPNRLEYLQRMAILEMQLRRFDEALATGERLLSEPGSTPQHLKFFIALCGEARQREKALAVIRRHVERNPRDASARLILAKAHLDNGQIDQAINDGWMTLERATGNDLAQETLQLLIGAYRKLGRLTELPELLQRFGLEHERQRDATFWIAFTQNELGDSASAWQSLEKTLGRSNSDIELAKLALKVAVASGKTKEAVECQRQLNQLEPTHLGQLKLGELLFDAGDIAASTAEWRKALDQRKNDAITHRFARDLIAGQRDAIATAFLAIATEALPDNWELLALGIAAHQQSGKSEQAVGYADRVLRLKNPFDQTALVLEGEVDTASAETSIARINPGVQTSNIEIDRLAWLERADQWQQMFNSADPFRGAIRWQESVATLSQRNAIQRLAVQRGAAVQSRKRPSFYQPTFGDAHALAVLAKYGRVNLDITQSATQLAFIKRCSESKDIGQLWDAILLLQPTAIGPSEMKSDVQVVYRKCLDELVALQDGSAIQLALNNVVLVRSMQTQMAARRMESVPNMHTSEIARFEHLLSLCHERKHRPNLFVDVQLAKELELVGRGQDAKKVFTRGLASSLSLDEVARCSQEFIPSDVAMAKSIFIQGFEIHRDELISKPSADNSPALNAIFDDAWRRDKNEVGSNTNEFIAYLSKLLAIHGDNLDNGKKVGIGWDPSSKVEYSSQLLDGKPDSLSSAFLRPSAILPNTILMTLRHIAGVTQKGQASVELLNFTASKSTSTGTGSNLGRTSVQRACKSVWNWWHQKPQEAIAAVREAKRLGIAVEFFGLWESQLLIYTNEAAAAIEVLEQIKPFDEVMAVDRYLLVLQAAQSLSKSDLANEATKQLNKLPMTTFQREWFRILNDAAVQRP